MIFTKANIQNKNSSLPNFADRVLVLKGNMSAGAPPLVTRFAKEVGEKKTFILT